MAILKPFCGIRPVKDKAYRIASPPYDILNRQEATELAKDNPLSFLHVIKPEIDLPDSVDESSLQAAKKGKENLIRFISEGVFFQEQEPHLYVYAETMDGRTQYGIAGCVSVDEYMNGKIRKHENTKEPKVIERMNHISVSGFNYEPVFLVYRAKDEINGIVEKIVSTEPEYDFETDDGIRHKFWVIQDEDIIDRLVGLFEKVPYLYIADGHHRTEAAALAGNERRKNNPHHTGEEEYNYFLAVIFPDSELNVMDYNRVVKDLNGLTPEEFLKRIENLTPNSSPKERENKCRPVREHTFGMYLAGNWYSLDANAGTFDENDLIDSLDVSILSNQILAPILGIEDVRKSDRIDFVGGIRGLKELERRVDSGEMAVAFVLYPVTISRIMQIADAGEIMPPKTTWFEPKLRSGLLVHSLI